MCGISGIVVLKNKGHDSLAAINSVNSALFQRGPDGGTTFVHGAVAFGHRRLSIIDISDSGSQPMTTRDGRFTIVFNGEIFNYKTLRDQYLSADIVTALRSHSDTEILLLLFAKMGVKVFPLLEGFFAAAIYDRDTGEVVLTRDRFGKKPLLIFQDANRLVFGSEMKALFCAGIPRVVNWPMLPVYLQLNYVPQPYSLVAGVRKLQPGCYLKILDGNVSEHPYFQLELKSEHYDRYSYQAAQKRLVELMEDAVCKRLVADVPLGAFLSGGIDSSVVVALASRHVSKLKTFSIGYKDNAFFDETKYALMVAGRYKTEHTAFMLGNNDFLDHLPRIMDYMDEPFADSSVLPLYILSRYTKKHVTVALSGDGGDEVFAGYNKHGAEWLQRKGGVWNRCVQFGGPLWCRLPQSRNNPISNKIRQLNRFAVGAALSATDRYWRWASFLDSESSRRLLHPAIVMQIGSGIDHVVKQRFTQHIVGKDFNEVLLADMSMVLVGDMLVKVDTMSMANSLEVRSPFLDQDVVDFAFGLPASFKINSRMKKRIVQDTFRNQLPAEIYNRSKKGFEVPLTGWLRKELWPMIDSDLLQDRFVRDQAIFDIAAIKELKRRILSGNPGDSHATIWALIVFQHWWKRFFNN